MAEYIDREKLYDDIEENSSAYYSEEVEIKNECLSMISCAETADVVPRSEVDEIAEERDRYKQYYFRHEYDKWEAEIKQELISEYKELVKQYLLDRGLYLTQVKNAEAYAEAELKKKYQ